MAVSREDVLAVFRNLPEGSEITTSGVCFCLSVDGSVSERQVRAAISWLMLGGLVAEAGSVTRKDVAGRAYRAKLYRWTGKEDICCVHRDPERRRMARDAQIRERMRDLHAILRRPWV